MAKMILIVDDNPTVRGILCRILEAEADYQVCAQGANGKEAIELARKHNPDLIILDLSLPDISGLDAASQLKTLQPHIPIILFTQHSESGDQIGFTNLNVDRIVSKGDIASLMRHVRSLAPAVPTRGF